MSSGGVISQVLAKLHAHELNAHLIENHMSYIKDETRPN